MVAVLVTGATGLSELLMKVSLDRPRGTHRDVLCVIHDFVLEIGVFEVAQDAIMKWAKILR